MNIENKVETLIQFMPAEMIIHIIFFCRDIRSCKLILLLYLPFKAKYEGNKRKQFWTKEMVGNQMIINKVDEEKTLICKMCYLSKRNSMYWDTELTLTVIQEIKRRGNEKIIRTFSTDKTKFGIPKFIPEINETPNYTSQISFSKDNGKFIKTIELADDKRIRKRIRKTRMLASGKYCGKQKLYDKGFWFKFSEDGNEVLKIFINEVLFWLKKGKLVGMEGYFEGLHDIEFRNNTPKHKTKFKLKDDHWRLKIGEEEDKFVWKKDWNFEIYEFTRMLSRILSRNRDNSSIFEQAKSLIKIKY
jgi:hypothetical protein